jgi:hypothetical protein
MVELDIQGLDGVFTIEVRALAFPVICSPVATRVDIAEVPQLDGLEFADEVNGASETIDILLGADYYYEVVTGEIIKGEMGPTAIQSKFVGYLRALSSYVVLYPPTQLLTWSSMAMELLVHLRMRITR